MSDHIKQQLSGTSIFVSYMGPVCQLSGHQKSICPVLTAEEKVMVPFKVKGKNWSWSDINIVIDMQELKMF